jgi:phosphatidylglycerol:prolipoprotein diacylglycerol transferase
MDTRVAFSLFGFDVYWYGIVITTAMIAATYIAAKEFERRGKDPNIIWNGMVIVLGLGILGARMYHVFSEYNDGTPGWSFYRANPTQIFNLRSGGLGIFGGLIGGAIGATFVALRNKVNWWFMADCIAPGLPLGQAIGRWGNFFNQELYGAPTGSSWWGVTIQPWARVRAGNVDYSDLQKFPLDTRFHPAFFYESIWSLAGFLLLMWVARKFSSKLISGDLFAFYLIWYGIGRGLIESQFRLDAQTYSIGATPLPTAVLLALVFIVLGAGILISNRLSLFAAK